MKSEDSQKGKIAGLVIASLIFIIGVVINYYMREGLFLLGINMISNMQQSSGAFLDFI